MRFLRHLIFSQQPTSALDNLVVNDFHPGTILHDFEAFLTYVDEREMLLTNMHQLRRRMLPEINARLAVPLQHGLTHPLQQSFPHIHGLYLLLRASGMTFVKQTGAGPLLVVDGQVRDSWEALNATERYCTLLETWLLRGEPEIIGETSGPTYDPCDEFDGCARFCLRFPEKGLHIIGEEGSEDLLRHAPGRHHLGLLELFGLIHVESSPPLEGKGWQIDVIERTSLAEPLLALLHAEFLANASHYAPLRPGIPIPFGVLQSVLQPYFPEWKQTLVVPEWPFREGVHVFEVTLGAKSHQIGIPAGRSLDDLASTIVDAFKLDPDHFYRFSYRDRFGVERCIYHPELEEEPQTGDVRVGDVPLRPHQPMIFLFDFGRCREFQVTFVRVADDMRIKKPTFLRA